MMLYCSCVLVNPGSENLIKTQTAKFHVLIIVQLKHMQINQSTKIKKGTQCGTQGLSSSS